MESKAYVISVSLHKGCYRHIKISGGATLAELHGAILNAFGFNDDHAHAFYMNNKIFDDSDCYYLKKFDEDNKYRHTCDYTLDSLSLEVGRKFIYLFDFGDEWAFQCRVLRINDEEAGEPVTVRSVGDSPDQYDDEDSEDDEDSDDSEIFPEFYSKDELNKLYKGLGLSEEGLQRLRDYFTAVSMLYNIIPLEKAYELITNDMDEPLDREVFTKYSEIVSHDKSTWFYVIGEDKLFDDAEPSEKLIIVEHLIEFDMDDFYSLYKMQRNKPYFIPPKGELIKYADEEYYVKTPQTEAMASFLRCTFKERDAESDDILSEVIIIARIYGMTADDVIDELYRMNCKMNKDETGQFVALYNDLYNHLNQAVNRGFTPDELVKKIRSENSHPEISELLATEIKPVFKRKIGANEPCPCGSGLKFKKCCRGNGKYD